MSEWMNLSINHFFYQFISPFISLFAANPVLVLLTLWSITAYFYSDFLSLNNFSKLCTTLTDFLFSRNMSLYSDTNRPSADLPSSEVTDCGHKNLLRRLEIKTWQTFKLFTSDLWILFSVTGEGVTTKA